MPHYLHWFHRTGQDRTGQDRIYHIIYIGLHRAHIILDQMMSFLAPNSISSTLTAFLQYSKDANAKKIQEAMRSMTGSVSQEK
jgi:hypothetical protein